jgi:hypothetical protein
VKPVARFQKTDLSRDGGVLSQEIMAEVEDRLRILLDL